MCKTEVTKNVMAIKFPNGKQLLVNLDTLSESIQKQAIFHALTQKCWDATIGMHTPEEEFEAVKAVLTRITGPNPTWTKVNQIV